METGRNYAEDDLKKKKDYLKMYRNLNYVE